MTKKSKRILAGLSSWQDYQHREGKSKRLPLATPKPPKSPVEITRKKRGPSNPLFGKRKPIDDGHSR